ncbi:sulfite reductase subunit alpha [Indioceanicola profundi]|uniref:sulfite reductase subunit alpha n=1 Tax=Indioceanicola profundi TaxID=2220096 RepID=UPI0019697A97|nr:flavodoxin domain-containing protein [Indioceanicola profundi]
MGASSAIRGSELTALLAALAGSAAAWIALDSPLLDHGARQAVAAASVLLGYGGFTASILRGHRLRSSAHAAPPPELAGEGTLVIHASQTGFAEQLAERTADMLAAGGGPVRLLPLSAMTVPVLEEARQVLFLVSTTGEGDAPDSAAGFLRRSAGAEPDLTGLRYGLLALGDRSYAQFCAFGHRLDGWLRRQGATPLFDLVEVDNGDPGAIRHWQHHLGQLSGNAELADWAPARYEPWTLAERTHLNPGSPGAPVVLIRLTPQAGSPTWQAGDIAEIGPRHPAEEIAAALDRLELDGAATVEADGWSGSLAERLAVCHLPDTPDEWTEWQGLGPQQIADRATPLPHREYSIASIPADGRLELVVRQARRADGRLGLGSGWLTAHAPLGGTVDLRLRENRSFHAPEGDRPMILIGNGTGIAGLRAHLKARAVQGRRRNWLLFGERTAAHDFHFKAEIRGWHAAGHLGRLDLAFSRDQAERVYVQHRLAAAADDVARWVDEGAVILVCGSLGGMAAEVSATLASILGQDRLEEMADAGLYRRDVY